MVLFNKYLKAEGPCDVRSFFDRKDGAHVVEPACDFRLDKTHRSQCGDTAGHCRDLLAVERGSRVVMLVYKKVGTSCEMLPVN